jgi:hypothetical protein
VVASTPLVVKATVERDFDDNAGALDALAGFLRVRGLDFVRLKEFEQSCGTVLAPLVTLLNWSMSGHWLNLNPKLTKPDSRYGLYAMDNKHKRKKVFALRQGVVQDSD